MRAGLLLFPAALFISSFAIAQDEDQPAPSSHPMPSRQLHTRGTKELSCSTVSGKAT